MFDRIARRYDLLNRLMSFGLDERWRRLLVKNLFDEEARSRAANKEGYAILDVATGTADVALAIAAAYPTAHVTGLDPSREMLAVGHVKVTKLGLVERVTLTEGDAQALPYKDGQFAASCISFGIRNVPDRMLGLRELARVTQRGGRVVVLELNEPEGLLAPFAKLHVHHIVPWLGAWLSGAKEYRYLQESIEAFPSPAVFAGMMETAGLRVETAIPLAFGSAHLYVARA
jgi:demethylmenaquinone methyltransferase/2-methoxy-6-polyprenyl-1,4-benzoquinol methylase